MSNDFDDDDEDFEADKYELDSSDLTVVKTAIQLLKKIILGPLVSPAEVISVSKAMHVLKRLPHTSSEMNVSITLTGPRRSFHGQEEKHEIYHWWEVEIEETLITITSRGYFYRQSTGGDSFIAMDWKAAPGCETDHAVFLDQLGLVDDAQPFEQEVMQIDLSKPGYKLTVNDEDNTLLEEIAEDEESDDLSESSLDEDEDEDAGFDAGMTTGVHVEKVTRGEVAGSGLPLSEEIYRAIAVRVFGEIRLGVKRFDALIKSLRADFDESIVNGLKPNFIAIWNSVREKYGLDEATEPGFDLAMSDTVDGEVEQATQGKSQVSGFPISDELAQALAKRTIGAIRLGIKQFDAFIKTLRADMDEADLLRLKPTFIRVWNAGREKFGLDEATELGFDAAMSNTADVDVEQATEAAKSATTVTCKQCGTKNRVGEVPLGRKAVCCSCRSVLGSMESPCPPKRSAKLSVAWAWIAMLVVGLVAWIAVYSHSGRRKESTSSSGVQSQPSKGYSSDYSSSSGRQIPPTPQKPAFTQPEQALPPHGKITWYSNGDPIAPLEIRSSRGSHYVVKLSDYDSERELLSVFVHGGSTINLDVPLGTYSIKYASGDHWYGSTHLFGPETAYYKADSSFDFRVTGNHVSGYTLTLYKVVDGNLQTTPISPNEF